MNVRRSLAGGVCALALASGALDGSASAASANVDPQANGIGWD